MLGTAIVDRFQIKLTAVSRSPISTTSLPQNKERDKHCTQKGQNLYTILTIGA